MSPDLWRPLTGADLERFHGGDHALFDDLVTRHSTRLLAFVRSFAKNPAEAHDLLQETWRLVYSRRKSYGGTGSVLGWCLAVARNICLTKTRQDARAPEALAVDEADRLPGPVRPGPETLAGHGELRRAITMALYDLPPRERQVVLLRLVQERSTRETAQTLLCAEGTVKATLHHAIRKLQVAMNVWERA